MPSSPAAGSGARAASRLARKGAAGTSGDGGLDDGGDVCGAGAQRGGVSAAESAGNARKQVEGYRWHC